MSTRRGPLICASKSRDCSCDGATHVVQGVQGFPGRALGGVRKNEHELRRALVATCRALPAMRACGQQSSRDRTAPWAQRLTALETLRSVKHPRRSVDAPATNRRQRPCASLALACRASKREERSDARVCGGLGMRVLLRPRSKRNEAGADGRAQWRAPSVARVPVQIGKVNSAPSRARCKPRGSTPGQVTTATAACSRSTRVAVGSTGKARAK